MKLRTWTAAIRAILATRAIIAALMTLAAIWACDDFSLLGEFGDAPELAAQRTEIERYASMALYPSGGTPPYSYEVLEDRLFYAGATPCQASASNNMFTAGDSVGGVLLRLRDSAGRSAEIRLTILPPPPENFQAASASTNSIGLTWTFSGPPAAIGGFMIERSVNGGAFQEILPMLGSGTISYVDNALNPTLTYSYRMRSVAGEYRSPYTATRSAQPGT